jgi:hypothetical protein
MKRNKTIFRIEPGASRGSSRPHNTVYNAFSRNASLQVSASRTGVGGGVILKLSRQVGTGKKDLKLLAALDAMSANRELLGALLSDAFGHAAVKYAQENYRGGWTVDDSQVGVSNAGGGFANYSATVRLRRFIG